MILTVSALLLLGLILFPQVGMAGASQGLILCARRVIPALFPYFFLTQLLLPYLPKGRKHPCLPAYVMGFVGGYPTGVATAVGLYEEGLVGKREANTALGLCNHSGPGFFLTVIGLGLFGSVRKGVVLYGIHVLSALLLILLCGQKPEGKWELRQLPKERKGFAGSFYDALAASCEGMLRVCGVVILFSVGTALLKPLLPISLWQAVGLIELCNGIALLTQGDRAFVLCALFMGWGGLCVHMQAMSLWQRAGLKPKDYWRNKASHGVLSGLLAGLFVYGGWKIFCICTGILSLSCYFYKKWGRKKGALAL